MARPKVYDVAQAFLKHADVNDSQIQKTLKVKGDVLDAFTGALNAITPESGSAMINLEQVLGKPAETMIQKMAKAGLIKRHSDGDRWILSTKAYTKLIKLNARDTEAPAPKKAAAKKRAKKGKPGRQKAKKLIRTLKRAVKHRRTKKVAEAKRGISGMTVAEIKSNLQTMDDDIKRIATTRDKMRRELVELLKQMTK